MAYSVLVTGGTGSLGLELLRQFLADPECRLIRAFNRSERSQYFARQLFQSPSHNIEWHLGDVRNLDSVRRVANGVDVVVHTAAMKQVHIAEENVWECLQSNVQGTHNVVTACAQEGVHRLVNLSTDKAANPSSVYGYSKYLAERIVQEGRTATLSSTSVRFGNLLGSEGSVIDLFVRQALSKKVLTITDPTMTRFFVPISEAASLVRDLAVSGDQPAVVAHGGFRATLEDLVRGFQTAWKTVRNEDLARAQIPVRAGERAHEEILSSKERALAYQRIAGPYTSWAVGGAPTGNEVAEHVFSSEHGPFVASGWLAQLLTPVIEHKLQLVGAN